MVQSIELENDSIITVVETREISQVKDILGHFLYVPDERLKAQIITELVTYFQEKFSESEYKIAFFIAKQNEDTTGFVVCQVDTVYKSYARKCGTFGWLHAQDFETCKALINSCEKFLKSNKIRRIRGPINFPTFIGGIGFQIKGFDAPMMQGVAFSDPDSNIVEYIQKLGYHIDSKYTCVRVIAKSWRKGKHLDPSVKLGFRSIDEIKQLKPRIMDIAQNSFYSILADAPGGVGKFDKMMEIYSAVPKSHYKLPENFDLESYFQVPEYIEAAKSCDLENVVISAPMAFDREAGELVGLILAVPNLYQIWLKEQVTQLNVDTVMIDTAYTRRGIMSAMNNIGQLRCDLNRMEYYEGTTIWSNNERAVNAIFPHCIPVREHVVVQKRIK